MLLVSEGIIGVVVRLTAMVIRLASQMPTCSLRDPFDTGDRATCSRPDLVVRNGIRDRVGPMPIAVIQDEWSGRHDPRMMTPSVIEDVKPVASHWTVNFIYSSRCSLDKLI